MAEALLNHLCGEHFEASSAGLEPGKLNPLVVDVMAEDGLDVSGHQTQGVFDVFKRGDLFAYVISVCDEASAERCPIFPGMSEKIAWSFEDPSLFSGTPEEKLEKTRVVRDQIKQAVISFVKQRRATSHHD